MNRVTKLRWRRRLRQQKEQVEHIGESAEAGLEQHFFGRLHHIVGVRRFIFSWILLLVLLAGGVVIQMRGLSRFYQDLRPGVGGIMSEGIVGSFTGANPVYATSPVDASVARLVFSSLMKYDSSNQLVGDLAENLDANPEGDKYTVRLRENILWHDGQPLTAEDVVFTYQTIQKPDARSPLLPNWRKVEIKAVNERTVEFKLPHGLASFPHSLTNGIVPKHILGKIPPADLRSAQFNTVRPVGSGPFKWEDIQVSGGSPENREEQVGLVANNDYYKGPPKIERFVVRAIHNQERLARLLEAGEVRAAAGLSNVPPNLSESSREYSVPLTGQVMVFFKNSNEILKDRRVRRALTRGTNQAEIIRSLGYPVLFTKGPLLSSHTGYNKDIVQYSYDIEAAKKLLDKAGWKVGTNGIRERKISKKQTLPLTFELHSQSGNQYAQIAQDLQKQWKELGVDLKVTLEEDTKLQSTIAFHSYDALLYGITLGSDPDVYAYWHSSQADPRSNSRLNLSEYKSNQADAALEAGRSRVAADLRQAKYRPLLEAWRRDAPGVALYQPRYLYITNNRIFGFEPTVFNSPTDRYANVEGWAVRQDRVNIY